MTTVETLSVLISATLTLMAFTILYRENPSFRLTEHILVGATVGHSIVIAISQIQTLAWLKVQRGITVGDIEGLVFIIPIVLGILLYTQFSSRFRHISRVPIALMLAVGLSLTMRGLLFVNVIGQIKGALKPLTSMESIICMFGLVCVLLYFVYERRVSKVMGPLPKIGRYFLMLTMGAYFAHSIMGMLSIVIGHLEPMLIAPALYLIPIAFLIILADIIIRRKSRR